jgi:mycofactocin precursor
MEKENREIEIEERMEPTEMPAILEEITIEELAVDGICGIY